MRVCVCVMESLCCTAELFFFFFFLLFRAAPAAYVSSQVRGPIEGAVTCLHYSHSNAGFKPHLQPTLLLTATPYP